jgi:hypothetical protein
MSICAFGLVQNVYLFGSPVVVKKDEYLAVRSMVAGRFVNGYNRNDWILGYLFRLTNGGIRRVAGLAPVEEVVGIENMDCTEWVVGHMDYRTAMPKLLRECGWLVESDEFTEIEDPDPENHTQRQRELINEIEEARKELEKEGKASKGSGFRFWSRKKKAEKQDWEIYEDSAKAEAAGGAGAKTDDPNGTPANGGVLFDVDAIRAELAKEPAIEKDELQLLQVKELQSTLPPMRLDLGPSSTPNLAAGATPAAPSYPLQNPRDALRETRSMGGTPSRLSYDYRSSYDNGSAGYTPSYGHSNQGDDDGVSMTFDSSFSEAPAAKTPTAPGMPSNISSSSIDTTPPKEASAATGAGNSATRPTMQTAQTMPNITISDPWADEDDPEFGKEKEISMTFA